MNPVLINTKELRASMEKVVKQVNKGARFTVLYRSHPAFQIIPIHASEKEWPPLERDPIYQAKALIASGHPGAADDHDLYLYSQK